jgi:hypothetical protein
VINGLAERQAAFYLGLVEFDRCGRGWLDWTEHPRQAALNMLQAAPTT